MTGSLYRCAGSRQQVFDDMRRLDAGESLILEGEPLVVESQKIQHGGMKVMNMNGIVHDVVRKVIGLSVNCPPLRSTAGHPHRETPRMMIAAVVLFRESPLRVD